MTRKILRLLILLQLACVPALGETVPSCASNAGRVIYGISASQLAAGSGVKPLVAVRDRLPEIRKLGANVLWLQPIFDTADPGPEQGYDITDYMKLKPSLGTEKDLKDLVGEAHRLGMKVILDVALNHTDYRAPFAKDVAQKGKASRYYGFYQHQPWSQDAYSQFLHVRKEGQAEFSYYFWDELVNLDYDNPEVRKYALQVLERWMRKNGVDGYRLDAAWGPEARWPAFYQTVARDLRSIKPDAFLLAEDKAATFPTLKGRGFDAAYDWDTSDPKWVSKWAFQDGDKSSATVFNDPDPAKAAGQFVNAVRNSERSPVNVLRYTENNDTESFNHSHTAAQARFASEAMFLLPGVPLVFYGQEVGNNHEQWNLPAFDPTKPIRATNPSEWDFYQKLIALRNGSRALSAGSIENLRANPDGTATFTRRCGDESHVIKLDFRKDSVTIDSMPIEAALDQGLALARVLNQPSPAASNCAP